VWGLIPPLVVSEVINIFSQETVSLDNTDNLASPISRILILIIALGLGTAIVGLVRLTAKEKLSQISVDLRHRLKVQSFNNLMNHSLQWHEKESSGNKIERINSSLQAIRSLIRLLYQNLIKTIITAIGGVIGLLSFGIEFFMVAMIVVVIVVLTQKYFSELLEQIYYAQNKISEDVSGKYYEGISNLATVKNLGLKENITEQIAKSETDFKRLSYKGIKYGTDVWRWFNVYSSLGKTVILLIAVWNIVNGNLQAGTIVILVAYFDRIYDAAVDSSEYYNQLLEAKVNISRLFPILEDPEVVDGDIILHKPIKQIKFRDVSFQYNKERTVLDGLNIEFAEAGKYGIAGRSGSGKSTMIKLLLQIYQPTNGEITINGINLREIDNTSLTSNIVIVPQTSELFNLSLKENITVYKELDWQLLQTAIEAADLAEFISTLPDGLDTKIGEGGYKASGGERQRIAIARAIYSNADVYVFDESTSSLDSNTEYKIQKAIEDSLQDKTLIFVAHRLSTLKNMDQIYLIHKGLVSESGTFSELVETAGQFAELYQKQKI
jgi:ABC-type multidrug transport system fused ATPase/permease subunit